MKTVRNVVAAVLTASFLAGCGTGGTNNANSTGTWWKNNLAGYWYVWKRDATDLYRSVDRHFFNYDWEDPYLP